MKVITSWNQIQQLDNISPTLKAELKRYFKELVTEMLDEPDYKHHDIGYIGLIAVMESNDDIHHLPQLGMTEETVTLLELIPEYIDLLTIGDKFYFRIVIILSADVGRVIYASEELITGELKTWIDKWKEV